MAPSLRRVFGLWKRLQEHRDTFWCFSEAISPQPLFPSLTAPDEVVAPGEVSLVQLFPIPKRRVALFVTPSFLCSEPQRAFELLQWFYETWAKRTKLGSQTCKLVTAYDLSEYLETLALQKAREREDVLREHKENLAKGESAANVMGLSLDDCAYRFKAWSLALELHYLRTKSAGPYEGDEDLASLQYADQCIDPDDEQSLVNWFGWWSSARMDQFRGFYVVGSDSTLRPEKLSRVVRIPRYSETTFSDPDVVLEEVDRLTQERDRQQGQERHGSPSQHAPTISAPRTTTPYVWRSRRVVREDAFSFTTALAEIWANRRRTRETFVTAYKFPVSWLNSTQAEALRGHEPSTRSFHTLHQWWRFPNPFWTHHAHKFCTYLGFFYTTVDELPQPAAEFGAPVDERPPRHPWLCIYRPAEPYTRKPRAGACELIIWDPAAQDRFAGVRAPKEGDLTFMQRQAIQVIRNGTEMKNQGSWLETVWLGGFDHPRRADSDHPVDLTLQYMEDIVNHVEEELPVGETALRSRGFRKVKPRGAGLDTPGDRSPAGSKPTNTRSQGFNAAGENDDDDEDTRLIFHPPRGRPLPSGERTKCINRLYECAATTSRNDPQATHMRYASPPTTEWYDVQRSEGRSFEHVYVAPWGYVFKALRVQAAGISGSDTPRTSNARQEEQQQQQQQVGRVVSGH
jgi:chromo domain-containing protein 1